VKNWLLALLAFAIAFGCSKKPSLSTDVYVWQQVRTPEVDAAILRAGPFVDRFLFHSADISFRGTRPDVKRFEIPWSVVKNAGKPAGIVLRIPFAEGGLGSHPEHVDLVAAEIRRSLASAKSSGPACVEVQIDYDCPSSRLRLYADFLSALIRKVPEVPIAFTALPSWQSDPAFKLMAAATGNYVLQVHSLRLPWKEDPSATICDIPAAKRAISHAAKLGIPFRLALPTYSCIVQLDADGRLVSVVSEDITAISSRAAYHIPGAAHPEALAALVAELKTTAPGALRGIIWYRLPVDSDRLNWSWLTFLSVSSGRPPASKLEYATVPQPEGFSKVEVRNSGEREEKLPTQIVLNWSSGSCESADALAGATFVRSPDGKSCTFSCADLPALPPGQTAVVGWVRGAGDIEIHAEN
jgi:hypothetical protein